MMAREVSPVSTTTLMGSLLVGWASPTDGLYDRKQGGRCPPTNVRLQMRGYAMSRPRTIHSLPVHSSSAASYCASIVASVAPPSIVSDEFGSSVTAAASALVLTTRTQPRERSRLPAASGCGRPYYR